MVKKAIACCLFACVLPFCAAASDGLRDLFDCEGNDPFRSPTELEFSALASKRLTANGHGWRNELKKRSGLRADLYETAERLEAQVEFELSPGAKTIVVQYHDGGTGLLAGLFIADIAGRGLANGIAGDGVFDLFLRVLAADGSQKLFPFGAMESGARFGLRFGNRRGTLSVSIDGKRIECRAADAPGAYLKFGDYLQAQDAESGARERDRTAYGAFYASRGIEKDRILFSAVSYVCGD